MGMSIAGRTRVGTVLVLVLFTVAFLLRAVGADYGYFHGDERINEAAKVLTGHFQPVTVKTKKKLMLVRLLNILMIL